MKEKQTREETVIVMINFKSSRQTFKKMLPIFPEGFVVDYKITRSLGTWRFAGSKQWSTTEPVRA